MQQEVFSFGTWSPASVNQQSWPDAAGAQMSPEWWEHLCGTRQCCWYPPPSPMGQPCATGALAMERCREVLWSGSINLLGGRRRYPKIFHGGWGSWWVSCFDFFLLPLAAGLFFASGSTEQQQVGRGSFEGMAVLDSLGGEAEKKPSLQGPGRLQCARLSHLTFTEPHLLAQAIHFLHLKDNFIL